MLFPAPCSDLPPHSAPLLRPVPPLHLVHPLRQFNVVLFPAVVIRPDPPPHPIVVLRPATPFHPIAACCLFAALGQHTITLPCSAVLPHFLLPQLSISPPSFACVAALCPVAVISPNTGVQPAALGHTATLYLRCPGTAAGSSAVLSPISTSSHDRTVSHIYPIAILMPR